MGCSLRRLILSMDHEVCLGLVEGAQTEEQPEGDLALAWKKLCEKFEPTTNNALADLKLEFAECRLEDGDEPEAWIVDLERMILHLKKDFGKEFR